VRFFVDAMEDRYNVDLFVKMADCLTKFPLKPGQLTRFPVAPWVNVVSSPRQGAPQECINAMTLMEKHVSRCLHGGMAGKSDLAQGELLFYQGDVKAAEPLIVAGLEKARESKQFDYVHRGLFYILRIAAFQGNRAKAEQALKDIEALKDEKEFPLRFVTYDIAFGWYQCFLRRPEMVPAWLREDFARYSHALYTENYGNQIKARYHYLTKNWQPMLAYIEDMKRRESTLFGRTTMMALEACARYQMRDKEGAFDALSKAYETASPNGILMPFIVLDRDMRALTGAVLRSYSACKIPRAWLKSVNHKSYSYARNQAQIISDSNKKSKKNNDAGGEVTFSSRETEVLRDLYYGLSKSEIAAKQGLSINTVKMVTKIIYEKLDVRSIADLVRVVAELKLVR
jgi:DNA-binding CsgD family transcriptional regulator